MRNGKRDESIFPFTLLSNELDLIDEKVILEFKAASEILPIHKQQALAYLRASGLPLAMVINFGSESVAHARVANTRRKPIQK